MKKAFLSAVFILLLFSSSALGSFLTPLYKANPLTVIGIGLSVSGIFVGFSSYFASLHYLSKLPQDKVVEAQQETKRKSGIDFYDILEHKLNKDPMHMPFFRKAKILDMVSATSGCVASASIVGLAIIAIKKYNSCQTFAPTFSANHYLTERIIYVEKQSIIII